MRRVSEAEWEAIRVEYVTSPDKPSLKKLAEKYGLATRTLEKRSVKEGWLEQRKRFFERFVDVTEQATEQTEPDTEHSKPDTERTPNKAPNVGPGKVVQASESEKERAARLIKWLRDYLVGLAREVGRGLVPTASDPQEVVEEIRKMWAELSPATRARLLPQIVRAAGDLIRVEQLLLGEPTERIEVPERHVEVTDEEAEVLRRVWRRATMMRRSGGA